MGLPWQTRLNSSIIDGDACSAAAGRCCRRDRCSSSASELLADVEGKARATGLVAQRQGASAIGRDVREGFAVMTGFPQRRIV